MRRLVVLHQHKDRIWAVEGCGGIGRRVAQRLVTDGIGPCGVARLIGDISRFASRGHVAFS